MTFTFREPTSAELETMPGEDVLRRRLSDRTLLRILVLLDNERLTGWYYGQTGAATYEFESFLDSITHPNEVAVQQLAIRCYQQAAPPQHHRPPLLPEELREYIGATCEYCDVQPLATSDNGVPIYPPGTPGLPLASYTERSVMMNDDEYPTVVWVQDGTDEPWTIGDYKCMVPICPLHNKEFGTRVLSDEERKAYE